MAHEDADIAVRRVGERMRTLRAERQLTLRALSELTNLSPQMLSQVERGATNPSIGTLVAVAAALEVGVGELFGENHQPLDAPLMRRNDQAVMRLGRGVVRRIILRDLRRHMEIAETIYPPGQNSARQRRHHTGYEYATVLSGTARVDLGYQSFVLEEGDSIRFASTVNHRYVNESANEPARVLVVNLLI